MVLEGDEFLIKNNNEYSALLDFVLIYEYAYSNEKK